MAFYSPLACMAGRHRPIRSKVKWDNRHYTGNCKHCGAPIIRLEKGKWREIKAEDEASVRAD